MYDFLKTISKSIIELKLDSFVFKFVGLLNIAARLSKMLD